MSIYPLVRFLTRITLRLYFRKIKIEGIENVPLEGPLLITPNHQNALLDALLVGAFTPSSTYYLTRSDVFIGWVKHFLSAIHMLPVYRIRDGYSSLSQNNEVFRMCKKLFQAGNSILIFPEGNHGEHHYLRPLTKGAARLAFQSIEVKENEELQILPVGLNFFDHRAPRSTVLIKYGKPIRVKDYEEAYSKNNAKGLIALRDAMSAAMKETLVIPNPSDNYQRMSGKIFRAENESLTFDELRSVSGNATFVKSNPKRFWAKVLNPIPYLFLRKTLSRMQDVVFHATIKYGFGISVFPAWWLLVFLVLAATTHIYIAGLTIGVMILGLFYSYEK